MLLRRLAQSVRKQDWFAVAIGDAHRAHVRGNGLVRRVGLDLSYDAEGRPVLHQFDFDAACHNRELRNAAWEISDLMWDWETVTLRASNQLGQLITRLDQHLVSRLGKAAP